MGVWHTYSTRQTLSELETDKSRGLSGAEAERRLARWGPNRLEEGRRQGLLLRFLGQMKDPMILVLLAAAALSLWASGGEDWLDAAIILVIVVVNACISISQEDSAEKALEALRKMSAPLAKVVRDGALQRLETDRLVPGDIIHLEAGDLVPADARILEAASLQADESAMTGESVPVSKGLLSALPEDTPLAERHNMVLASTVITRGRAVCVVTGTGMDTEVGRIAGLLLGEGEGQTPLQKKMAEISKTLSFVCLCVCAVMFGVGLLQGRPMLDMFLTAVSLAVAAIPEGLPAIVTIVLALGVARMARRRARTAGPGWTSGRPGAASGPWPSPSEPCAPLPPWPGRGGSRCPPAIPPRPHWWTRRPGRAWIKMDWRGSGPGGGSCPLTRSASS